MEENLTYQDLELLNYLNTRNVFANLTVSDLTKATVLGDLHMLLTSKPGTGKSQLATDIYNSYFGGNKSEQGHGIFIRANPETDIYGQEIQQDCPGFICTRALASTGATWIFRSPTTLARW